MDNECKYLRIMLVWCASSSRYQYDALTYQLNRHNKARQASTYILDAQDSVLGAYFSLSHTASSLLTYPKLFQQATRPSLKEHEMLFYSFAHVPSTTHACGESHKVSFSECSRLQGFVIGRYCYLA